MDKLEAILKEELKSRLGNLVGQPLTGSNVHKFNSIVKNFVLELEVLAFNIRDFGVSDLTIEVED